MTRALLRDLRRALPEVRTLDPAEPGAATYLSDATLYRGIRGHAEVIVIPDGADAVAACLAYAYAHDVPVTPRGGGSGYAAGAVPEGGILLATEGLGGAPVVDPERWCVTTPAGVSTQLLRERVAEQGLFYPPDPGSLEVSLIGGNIATNAGGPHSFKYGVTGKWVQSLDVVLAPGRRVRVGAGVSKDVSGLDLASLLVGSEGTLGIVCAAQLRVIPAPEVALPLLGRYPNTAAGVAAIEAIRVCGAAPATLEYLDANAADDGHFLVIAEADGSEAAAREGAAVIREAMEPGAVAIKAPISRSDVAALWRWRDGVSLGITARRGGKLSEDIVVPVTRLAEAIDEILVIGARHDLEACSWGHAGDGNLHATFLVDRENPAEIRRAEAAAEELFRLAARLGGSVSGEHGVGTVKRRAAAAALDPAVIDLQAQIKAALDPKGLLNPGKKLPPAPVPDGA